MPEDMTPSSPDEGFLPYDPADLDRTKASEDILRLLSRVERDAPGWKPEVGDTIAGTLVDITEGSSPKYGPYPLLILETPSGNFVGIHSFHHVLRTEFDRRTSNGTLKVGDLIALQYIGISAGKNGGNDFENYRIAIQQQS